MLQLTKIDAELSVFKGNKILIYGTDFESRAMFKLLKYFNLDILGFYNENENKCEIYGIKVITKNELENVIKTTKNIMLQIGSSNYNTEYIYDELKDIHFIQKMVHGETWCILTNYKKFLLLEKNKNILIKNKSDEANDFALWNRQQRVRNHIIKYCGNTGIIGCLPAKTGDYTLTYTFNENYINYCNVGHDTKALHLEKLEDCLDKIKIITAVREPISQNISCVFQIISDMDKIVSENFIMTLFEDVDHFFENLQNFQKYFDQLLIELYDKKESKCEEFFFNYNFIQNFLPCFQENIYDILKYPFDKEKGYTIIKDGKIEIFVYQLEKMDNIVNEMSDWIGEEKFNEWVKGNEASSKWISDSYKQAQKELVFTQEYFDKCYNEPYVKHFYSESDIEKFKAKWKNNVK